MSKLQRQFKRQKVHRDKFWGIPVQNNIFFYKITKKLCKTKKFKHQSKISIVRIVGLLKIHLPKKNAAYWSQKAWITSD